MNLETQQQKFRNLFEGWLQSYLNELQSNQNCSESLYQSQKYSLDSGGKRFRPFLTYLVFSLFSNQFQKIKNLCLSLEMVHTYSLIHDDLPCMDNDDFRRGKPTNHKVFSEDISLLAGDGLLSDVFYLLSADENLPTDVRLALIKLISQKIGSQGMVSGQAYDMKADGQINIEQLVKIHTLKTANLIQASALAAAIAAETTEQNQNSISRFAFHLGMAFQIKDDLLDVQDKVQDFKSYVGILGVEKTKIELQKHSDAALQNLKQLNMTATTVLEQLIQFNLHRTS